MRINIWGFGHTLSSNCRSLGFTEYKIVQHNEEISMLRKAIFLIGQKSRGNLFCNMAFKTLEEKRSFDEVFDDENIWISLVPNKPHLAALTIGKDIGISRYAFSTARRNSNPIEHLASVIVHELAHIAGAPDNPDMAEWLLMPCGFASQMDYGPKGITDL